MGLCSTLRVSSAASLAVVLLLGNPSFGQSSRSKEKSGSAKTSRRQERAAGVIIKVEPVVKGAAPGSTIEKEPKAGKARNDPSFDNQYGRRLARLVPRSGEVDRHGPGEG